MANLKNELTVEQRVLRAENLKKQLELKKTSPAEMNFELFEQVFEQLETLKPAPIADTMGFLELAEGEQQRLIFIGITQKESTQESQGGNLIDTALFVNSQKQVVMSMNKMLVEVCIENAYKSTQPLLITRGKDKRSKTGKTYYSYSVTRLK
jgi:hypothetical protein